MRIQVACSRNPLTDSLRERDIAPPGLEIDYTAMPVMDLFARALSDDPLDVVEFSLANHIMAIAAGDRRYVGLPVFPFRGFRHSMLWVRSDSPIERPEHLKGKRIGIAAYALTALVYVRGLLAEDYGVEPAQVEWVRTGRERIAFAPPPGVRIVDVGNSASLFQLLCAGTVDAIITFWSPEAQDSGARRLFPDVFAIEADYFRRTAIYPIMHTFALSRTLYDKNPGIAASLMAMFEAAKKRWEDDLSRFGAESASITPWSPLDLERSRAILGPDLYPYGIAANVRTLAAAIRYTREQHLIAREVAIPELFAPELI